MKLTNTDVDIISDNANKFFAQIIEEVDYDKN